MSRLMKLAASSSALSGAATFDAMKPACFPSAPSNGETRSPKFALEVLRRPIRFTPAPSIAAKEKRSDVSPSRRVGPSQQQPAA